MDKIQCYLTPISYILDLNSYGLVKGARAQLRDLSLAEFVLLSDGFTCSKYLNQVGEVKLKLLSQDIQASEEYKLVKELVE